MPTPAADAPGTKKSRLEQMRSVPSHEPEMAKSECGAAASALTQHGPEDVRTPCAALMLSSGFFLRADHS